jgi:tetratricopeptide (TPR) repeat protein
MMQVMPSVYPNCAAGRDAIRNLAPRAIVAGCRRALKLAPVAWLLVALAPGLLAPAAFGQALEPGAGEAQVEGETTDDGATADDGWAAYDRGDYVAARRIFEQRVAEGDADAAYGLAIMNANGMGGAADLDAAAELYGMAAGAGNAEAASALGYHYDFGLGVPLNKDLAEYWYRKAVDGGSLLGMNNLAYSWIEQRRNLRNALDMIREVVAAGMIDSATLDTLGWGLYELGAYREALPPLCQAVLLEPNHPELRTHLGDAYWRAGRESDARKQWQEALMLEANPHLLSPTGADFMQAQGRGEWRSRLADRIARGLAGPNRPRGDIGAPGIESEFTDDCAIPMS